MAFQSATYQTMGVGIQGEIYQSAPWSGQALTINSVSAAYNVIGKTVATWQPTQGTLYVAAGQGSDASTKWAGFLASPKSLALYNGDFTASMTVANSSQVVICSMGVMLVYLPAAANIGDKVCYNTTTGTITTIAPGATLSAGTLFAQAEVINYSTAGAGLAVIRIQPTYAIPAAA